MHALLVLLVLGCAASASAAGPASVALLPSVGTADDASRRAVDKDLQQALLAEDSVDLLAAVETRQHLMSLAEMGLVCLPEDVSCLVKLGIVASVQSVIVPVVSPGADGKLDVEISLIDVATAARARSVKGLVSSGEEAAIGNLVRRAMGLPERRSGADPPPAPPSSPSPPLGVVVAGVGGGVAVLAFGGAVICDLIYTNALDVADAKTRQGVVQPIGAALWATGLVGAAVAGVGAYLLVKPAEDQ